MRARLPVVALFGVAVVIGLALNACGSAPSLAWCADLNYQGRVECNYSSFQQCLEAVSGVGGSCHLNPRGGRRLR